MRCSRQDSLRRVDTTAKGTSKCSVTLNELERRQQRASSCLRQTFFTALEKFSRNSQRLLQKTYTSQNQNRLSPSSLTSNWFAQESFVLYLSSANTGHSFPSQEITHVSYAKQENFPAGPLTATQSKRRRRLRSSAIIKLFFCA